MSQLASRLLSLGADPSEYFMNRQVVLAPIASVRGVAHTVLTYTVL